MGVMALFNFKNGFRSISFEKISVLIYILYTGI